MVRRCLVRSAGWEAVGCVFLASGPQPGTLWIRETVHVRALLVALRRRQRERKREGEREGERERVCVCVFFVCVCVCVCLSLIFLLRSVVGRALSFLVRRHNDSSSVFTEEDKHKQKRGRREGKGTAGWSEKAALALLLNETPALVLVPKRLAIQNRFGLVTSVGCCFRFSHTLVQVFAHVCTKAVCRLQV